MPGNYQKKQMSYLLLLGRILYSFIFAMTVLSHFSKGAADYAGAQGVPMPHIFVPVSGIIAFLGAISIILGYKAKLGALLIIIFLIPVSFFMHNFWAIDDPVMMMNQQAHFMKNISILGAALIISYFGSGPFSIDK